MEIKAPHISYYVVAILIVMVISVSPSHSLEMKWVPTSVTYNPGETAKIPCNFNKDEQEEVNITWFLYKNMINITGNATFHYTFKQDLMDKTQILIIDHVQKNHSGLYKCQVTGSGKKNYDSCGTFLRIKDSPVYLFFDFEEATKNRLITAEGILLLFCAIIPGTILLYKKRFDNLTTLSLKQPEGENLYEGLNLEDCSMYEDISRGLQATYEDVGSLRVCDIQLEKP